MEKNTELIFQNFVLEANNKFNNKYIYNKSQFKNMRTKINIICPIHGNFMQDPREHLRSVCGCSNCSREALIEKNKEITKNKFFEDIIEKDVDNLWDYSLAKNEFNGLSFAVSLICKNCGQITKRTPHIHLKDFSSCKNLCFNKMKKQKQILINQQNNKIENINENIQENIDNEEWRQIPKELIFNKNISEDNKIKDNKIKDNKIEDDENNENNEDKEDEDENNEDKEDEDENNEDKEYEDENDENNQSEINKYSISNKGLVKNDETNKLIKGTLSNGYLRVKIYGKYICIHRLVGLIFIPNPENKPIIQHKDLNKQNNIIENLKWATYAEQNTCKNKICSTRGHQIIRINKDETEIKIFKSLILVGRWIVIDILKKDISIIEIDDNDLTEELKTEKEQLKKEIKNNADKFYKKLIRRKANNEIYNEYGYIWKSREPNIIENENEELKDIIYGESIKSPQSLTLSLSLP
jgi:hypothetical protein